MVWASPVCTEYSRALTTRPRRFLEGDALVLSALEIIARFDPLMWVIENPATGLLKTCPPALGGRDLLQVRNSVQEAAAGAAADGGAVREGQPITRAALQRSCRAVRGDCARGHGGACGAAEHSGLGFLWKMPIFSMFFAWFLGGATKRQKWRRGAPPAFFLVFWAHSKAVSLGTKNGAEGHRARFLPFLLNFKSGVTLHQNEAEGHRALFSRFLLNFKSGVTLHQK